MSFVVLGIGFFRIRGLVGRYFLGLMCVAYGDYMDFKGLKMRLFSIVANWFIDFDLDLFRWTFVF